MSKSAIELDQEDIFARLKAFPYFAEIKVLLQRRGVIESDVETALEAINSVGSKVGAVIIVLMPDLQPEVKDSPGPRYYVRYAVQTIVWPIAALGTSGAGYTSEEISEYVRQILHWVQLGRGNVLVFDGQRPETVKPGRVCWITYFRRLGVDDQIPKVSMPMIASATVGLAIQVTLTCTPGSGLSYSPEIYYTLDGSYPVPDGATSQLYSAPFLITEPCLLRVTAVADEYQQSDAIEADITPATS
jgi:hypothetical protein